MIFLAGDTHIPLDIGKLSAKNFPQQKTMTREDFVIVLGDFGLLWKKDKTYQYWLDVLSSRNYTLLWLDGNHENFDWLNSFPVEDWNGGKIHKIADNIFHLMRGNCFRLDNKQFFVTGGAQSYDKAMRIEGISWWKDELWSYQEQEHAFSVLQNLKKQGKRVDYVLSHTCPSELIYPIFGVDDNNDPTTKILSEINKVLDDEFTGWFFGHWHKDISCGKFHCLYRNLQKIIY